MKTRFQNKKSLMLCSAIMAFFLITGLPAVSSAFTYNINRVMTDGYGISTGTITTDDTIGPLGADNILSWELHLEADNGNGVTTIDISSANGDMLLYVDGLSATSTELVFDFASSTGCASFQAKQSGGGYFWRLNGTSNACWPLPSIEMVRTFPFHFIPHTSYEEDIDEGRTDGKIVIGTAVEDSDGDGVPDGEDNCPFSDLSETVVIDGWDTGVDNVLLEDGCTISDLISQCAEDADNHGEFVAAVSHITNYLKKEGLISGEEKGKIQKGAAEAAIP